MSKFKVGDRVRCVMVGYEGAGFHVGGEYEVSWAESDRISVKADDDGEANGWMARFFEPVTTSPIRTVTRREIVPGVYGVVRVDRAKDKRVLLDLWKANPNASELREAAHLFNQIAEVLEEQAAGDQQKEAA